MQNLDETVAVNFEICKTYLEYGFVERSAVFGY